MAERICLGCMEKINDKYIECPYCGYIDGIPAKEAYHMEPGSVLSGRYIVGRVVGYGGFGVTYIGYDGLLEKKIAIKEYLPSEFATRMPGQTEVTVYTGERQEQFYSGIDKFVEEAKRLAQFKEVSGIVRIYDSFTENKTAYIIMEYLEGETLKSRLKREGKLSVEDSLRIIMPILTALKEVHKIGIIHRDIAPDNIFLTSKGEVKLLDFGAARYATTTHSKSLSVIIKQGYAPEEQYRSRGDQGPWTDVYACGATLYKMLTGVTPEDSMERAGKDTLQPPSKQGVRLSKNLDTAIMNAMNIRIEDRTRSAEEFEVELISEAEVKKKKAHNRKMDIGKWPVGVKIGVGAVACGLITFGVLLATNVIHFDMKQNVDNGLLASNEVYVPNVVNYGVTEAEAMTLENSLILQITDKQNSDMIPKDKILSQNLTDGMVVKAGTALEVVVSAGGEIVYLQDLSGMELEEAKAFLDSLGIYYEIQEEESEIAPGYVIAQDVDENTGVEKGTMVILTVSTGISEYDKTVMTTVPELVGKDWNGARDEIKKSMLYIYKEKTEYSDFIPKGQVISQNIVAGTQTAQGTRIGVVVSLGIEMKRVPDVQYKSIEEATQLMQEAGLTVVTIYEENETVAKHRVICQSIEVGMEVKAGTVVTLYVSSGNEDASNLNKGLNAVSETENNITENTITSKVTVPNVEGMLENEARRLMAENHLNVEVEYFWDKCGDFDGYTHEQSILAGTLVDAGTTIKLRVQNNERIDVWNYRDLINTETYMKSFNGPVVNYGNPEETITLNTSYNTEVTYTFVSKQWGEWSEWGEESETEYENYPSTNGVDRPYYEIEENVRTVDMGEEIIVDENGNFVSKHYIYHTYYSYRIRYMEYTYSCLQKNWTDWTRVTYEVKATDTREVSTYSDHKY